MHASRNSFQFSLPLCTRMVHLLSIGELRSVVMCERGRGRERMVIVVMDGAER